MFTSRFNQLKDSFTSCVCTDIQGAISENEAFHESCQWIKKTHDQGGIVYFVGNGGSAGIASHFSNDLMKALKIASLTFYDSNLMTCLANDFGYDHVFSYPLERVIKPDDLLIAISSSGKSQNILKAAQVAKDRNIPLITFTGFSSQNPLRNMGNINYWVNEEDYGLVETTHFFLLHTLVDLFGKSAIVTQRIDEALIAQSLRIGKK